MENNQLLSATHSFVLPSDRLKANSYKSRGLWLTGLPGQASRIWHMRSISPLVGIALLRFLLFFTFNDEAGKLGAKTKNTMKLDTNNMTANQIAQKFTNPNNALANLMFDTAKSWLKKNGVEAIHGRVNFGDRDKWWGLLTKGFDLAPNYQCNYHMPYYQTLFENYGFQNYFNQFTFSRKITDFLHHRLKHKAELIAKDPDHTFEHLNTKMLKKQTLDIIEIYTKAWKGHKGVSQLTQEQGKGLDGALIINAAKTIQNLSKTYPVLEISGIGDFNKKMILVIKQVGGGICKIHTTYRYLFDRNKTFARMETL